MHVTHRLAGLLLSSTVAIGMAHGAGQAQIAPAANDANTLISRSGNTFNITGGTTAGTNLFHSFQTFGLNADQIANFRATPAIQNILGRVVGGDASVINGLVRVTGSHANLYLMNPAGIVFGATARLDVAGSFTATTATGVGFGNRWLNAIGSNDYAKLIGSPSSVAFPVDQPGAIVNAGRLTVGANQNLVLLGGTIVNTGQLFAPGGQVIVAAVPGQSLVRLSQPGSLLSVEITPLPPKTPRPDPGVTAPVVPPVSLPNAWTRSIASLPALLTGGIGGNATGLTIDPSGRVTLTGSGLPVEAGDVVARTVTAGTATLSAAHTLTLVESQLTTTGDLTLRAMDTVRLRDSAANPAILQAGNKLLIQGNQGIDLFALSHPDSGVFSGGDTVVRSANPIRSDVHYVTGGNLTFEDLNGNAGNLFSLDDPVILAQGDVTLGDYTGASLHILAGGSITLGAVIINDVDTTANTINPTNATLFNGTRTLGSLANITRADGSPLYVNVTPTLDGAGNVQRLPQASNQLVVDGSASPTLDVRAGINWAALGGLPLPIFLPNPFPPGTATTGPTLTTLPTSADITIASVSIANVGLKNTVLITNQYVPNLSLSGGAIQVGGQSIPVPAGSDPKDIPTADIYLNNAPGILVIDSRSSLTTGNIIARPSSIDLRSVGNLTTGDLAAAVPSQSTQDSIVLASQTGNILVNTIDAGSNGIDVQAGGLFQAIGAFNNILDTFPDVFSINVLPQTGTALRAFLDQKGITADPTISIPIRFPQLPIVTLIARPQSPTQTGKPAGSLNAPITISYGGGTRLILDQTVPVFQGLDPATPGIPTVGRIMIRGNDTTFYVGSTITPFLPTTSDAYLSLNNVTNTYEAVTAATNPQLGLYLNQQFTPLSFGSASFPSAASGVAAAIVIGGGNDNAFYGSTQNLQFVPPTPPGAPGGGNNGNNGSNGGNVTARSNQVGDGQATQRSLNAQTQASACSTTIGAIASVAGVPSTRGSDRASTTTTASNPCSGASDDTQILQILDGSPQP